MLLQSPFWFSGKSAAHQGEEGGEEEEEDEAEADGRDCLGETIKTLKYRPKVTERSNLQDSLVHLPHSDEHNNSEARAVRSMARILVADTCCLWSCPSTKQLEVKQSKDHMKFILNCLL